MDSQRMLLVGGLALLIGALAAVWIYDGEWREQQEQAYFRQLELAVSAAIQGEGTAAAAHWREAASLSAALYAGAALVSHLTLGAAAAALAAWASSSLFVNRRIRAVLALLVIGGALLLAAGDGAGMAGALRLRRWSGAAGVLWLALGLGGYALFTYLSGWPPHLGGRRRR